jgi:NitT/TauT family transport system permease protein
MNKLTPQARQRLMSFAALVSFFVLWELACLATGVSDLILPRPTQIVEVLWTKGPLL